MIRIPTLLEGAFGRIEQVVFPRIFRDDPDGELTLPSLADFLDMPSTWDAAPGRDTFRLSLGSLPWVARVRWPSWPRRKGPILLWHHASSEVPYTLPGPWVGTNLFFRLFLKMPQAWPADLGLGYIQAPFHETPARFRDAGYATAEQTLGMVAASVLAAEKTIQTLRKAGFGPITLAGYSLGGVVASWHLIRYGTADAYVPMAASPDFHAMLFSGFLPVEERAKARARLACHRAAFDLSGGLEPASMAKRCFPILGTQDELVPAERCREVWAGFDVAWIEEGHFTLFMKEAILKRHLLSHLPRQLQERKGETP